MNTCLFFGDIDSSISTNIWIHDQLEKNIIGFIRGLDKVHNGKNYTLMTFNQMDMLLCY